MRKLGRQIDMWKTLRRLQGADDAVLYRLVGHDQSGGYNIDVFTDQPVDLEMVARPWQQDLDSVSEVGQGGHTPGIKVYVSDDVDIARNDRIHYDGGEFRVVNPQRCTMQGVTRYDLRTDGRELIHESEIDEKITLDPPDRGGYGGE